MRIRILFLLATFSFSNQASGQGTNAEMAFYNIGFNAVFSGIGALINKKPSDRWSKTLLKGMGQGALGGYLIYESKNLIGNINDERSWEYSWYGKVVNAAGVSIVENASSNRNFWEKWHFNIGFNRVELHTKDQFRISYKVMPVSLVLTISTAIGNKFELERTLQTGEIIFSNSNVRDFGIAYGNVLLIRENLIDNFSLITHETIHIYQYYDYNFLNTYLNKPYAKWRERSDLFSKVSNYIYFDLNGVLLRPLYLLESRKDCYYDNFFENEATYYARGRGCD